MNRGVVNAEGSFSFKKKKSGFMNMGITKYGVEGDRKLVRDNSEEFIQTAHNDELRRATVRSPRVQSSLQ